MLFVMHVFDTLSWTCFLKLVMHCCVEMCLDHCDMIMGEASKRSIVQLVAVAFLVVLLPLSMSSTSVLG